MQDIPDIEGDYGVLPVAVSIVDTMKDPWMTATGAPFAELFAQFVNLDGVQERVQPSYNAMSVIGRMEQILVYAGSSNREIALQFQFRANAESDLEAVSKRALWLDALQLPWIDSSGLSNPPPPVMLEIGSHLTMRAIVMSAHITWVAPYQPGTLRPYGADVDVMFTSVAAGKYRRPSFDSGRYTADAAAVQSLSQEEFNEQLPPP